MYLSLLLNKGDEYTVLPIQQRWNASAAVTAGVPMEKDLPIEKTTELTSVCSSNLFIGDLVAKPLAFGAFLCGLTSN